MPGPLDGVRVLDLTRILAGPWCTQMLGDLGAEVIKVENPSGGDDTRTWGPPWLKDEHGNETDDAAYYFSANRNKSSITLDLKSESGREILLKLVAESDVFVENFKVGGLAKMGLGYADLKRINPSLIYLSITGFGQTGPMASQPGYDYLIQGLGGLMSITGESDDFPGGGPQRVGVAIVDINAGFYATIAILSALFKRREDNKGQYIDIALLDTQVGWLVNQAMNYLIGGEIPVRTGQGHPNLVPYQPFKTADGDIIIAVGNDRQFSVLMNFLGLPEFALDDQFATNRNRVKNRKDIIAVIATEVIKQPNHYWLSELPRAGVPCSIINNIEQVFEHPQVIARDMKIEMSHEVAGSVPGVANPIKFSESKIEYKKAPPMHGEHTDQVLMSVLGLQEEQIQELKAKKVI